MNPCDYKAIRELLGNQAAVAGMLGVTRETISRRESGIQPIDREAELAIKALKPLTSGNPNRYRLTLQNHGSGVYTAVEFEKQDVCRPFIWDLFQKMLASNQKES